MPLNRHCTGLGYRVITGLSAWGNLGRLKLTNVCEVRCRRGAVELRVWLGVV